VVILCVKAENPEVEKKPAGLAVPVGLFCFRAKLLWRRILSLAVRLASLDRQSKSECGQGHEEQIKSRYMSINYETQIVSRIEQVARGYLRCQIITL
jgi:hypothetical protein